MRGRLARARIPVFGRIGEPGARTEALQAAANMSPHGQAGLHPAPDFRRP